MGGQFSKILIAILLDKEDGINNRYVKSKEWI